MSRIQRRQPKLPDTEPRRGEKLATVIGWNPASGRGTVQLAKDDRWLDFDISKQTAVANRGYVDLFIGLEVSVKHDGDAVTLLRHLGEPPARDDGDLVDKLWNRG